MIYDIFFDSTNKYGLKIARNPWTIIFICLLGVSFASLGILRFRQEKNPLKLWIPPQSDFKLDSDWIMDTFQEGFRSQYLLIVAPNVLEPQVLVEAERIRKKIVSMSAKNVTYEEACFRIPAVKRDSIGILDIFGRRRKRSLFFFGKNDPSIALGFDPSLTLSSETYCRLVNKLAKVCLEMNIGQMWSNNDDEIKNLQLIDVIEKLNTTLESPVTGHAIAFPELLGGVTRDDTGKITGAKSLLSVWTTRVNFSEVDMDASGNDAGTSDWATLPILNWEAGFIDLLKNESNAMEKGNVSMYYEAGRSYADISGESMFQDLGKLVIGGILMFMFVQFVLPVRFNQVEMKFWLACVGLICVLLSFISAVGLCAIFGIPYGPVHTSLPFLLLGIGVDDVFVITSCFNNLKSSEHVDKQIATALKHAGVSISVTSATNCIAFLVGSFTILPCLQSFCLYAAVGIFIMYILQATLYVAVLALDVKRVKEKRHCILCCIKTAHDIPNQSSDTLLQTRLFYYIYDKFILKTPGMILIILLTLIMTGVAITGNMQLKQRFEPEWFLPNNSYLLQFITMRKMYYPDLGRDGAIFIGRGNYSTDFKTIHEMSGKLANETEILKVVDSWTYGFINYCSNRDVDVLNTNITQNEFNRLLSSYLWSPSGARFQKNFRLKGEFICGQPAPPIEMSSIDFIFRRFSGPEQYIPAMNKLKKLVADAQLPKATVWAKIFANWVTDEVIDGELYRNLIMAMVCVMLCTSLLIIDLRVCAFIFLCVLLTVINVAGFMHYWGLYIDIASCIALVLAVGLCVDFASHIGHTFLRITGTRRERVLNTVKSIGTASTNGGISTLLALSILGFSDAYIFSTFFKIFLLVILFGMFHGIVFLPIALSLYGSPSFNQSVTECSRELKMLNTRDGGNSAEETQQPIISILLKNNSSETQDPEDDDVEG